MASTEPALTGRCYCGAVTVAASAAPLIVTYCHCSDCRRISGAPVAALAAFEDSVVTSSPGFGEATVPNPGVTRWFCLSCGTQLGARYDYPPDQIYVPLGLWDQADSLVPETHSHADSALPWLRIDNDAPRYGASGRDALNAAGTAGE